MITSLCENVPTFELTWIEYLGDLGCCRLAVEHDDASDRHARSSVARSWYLKASDINPQVGHLYHRLAFSAETKHLQQLYYYGRSLSSVELFSDARKTAMPLFRKNLEARKSGPVPNLHDIEANLIIAHAHAFAHLSPEKLETASRECITRIDTYIGRNPKAWNEVGVNTAVISMAGWLDYGKNMHILRRLFLLRAKLREKPNYIVEELSPETLLAEQDPQNSNP